MALKKNDYPLAFAECRAFGHAWSVIDADRNHRDGRKRVWSKHLLLQCARCHSTREDYMNSIGGIGNRRYQKPMEYSIKDGKFHGRAEFRMMVFESHG